MFDGSTVIFPYGAVACIHQRSGLRNLSGSIAGLGQIGRRISNPCFSFSGNVMFRDDLVIPTVKQVSVASRDADQCDGNKQKGRVGDFSLVYCRVT